MSDPIARSYLSAAGREELPALTGLRILAALSVAIWHGEFLQPRLIPPFNHGYLGVDLFFILSGFIIAHVYWRDFLAPTRQGYVRFVALRLARLWPAHIAVVLLFVAMSLAVLILRGEGNLGWLYPELLLHLFLAQNWGFIPETLINYPSWSVSAEFLAYLLFPLQVLVFRRIDNPWLLALSVPLALLLCWLLLGLVLGSPLINAGPQANIRVLCEFAMGVALWRLWRNGRFAQLPWTAIVIACALGIVAVAAATPPRHVLDYAIVLLMAPLILGLAQGAGGRVLASRPLVYLGEISYSVYLMHIAAIVFARPLIRRLPWFDGNERGWDSLAVYLLVVLGFGALLFHLVEKPARLWLRARIERHMFKPAVA